MDNDDATIIIMLIVIIVIMLFSYLANCSTSPPGGNQVDGLPPAQHVGPDFVQKFTTLQEIRLKQFPLAELKPLIWSLGCEKLS